MWTASLIGRQLALGYSSVPKWYRRKSLLMFPKKATSSAFTSGTEIPRTTRLSRADIDSLDVRSITNHLPVIISHLQARREPDDTIKAAQAIASLSSQRVALIKDRDDHLHQRKRSSAVAGKLLSRKGDLSETEQETLEKAKQESLEASGHADKVEAVLQDIQTEIDSLLAKIPNLLDDVVPNGKDETENEVVSSWGDLKALPSRLGWIDSFQPLWHDDVALRLNGYLAQAAVQMSGTRFVALSGTVARLERALVSFLLDLHTQKHGYTEVSVPYIVGRSALEGTSQLPKFQDDLFSITRKSHTCNGEDAFLIPTAEVPITNLHRDSILSMEELPLSYVACTPCFRAEAGSSGRDTRGLIRTHQFTKVELVKITTSETSSDELEILTQHAEACLQALELPYRKVRLCAGDIGFPAKHCYDLEVWLPGAQEYREISSCSNMGDFQAQRMKLRHRSTQGKRKSKPKLCHTINGSGLAVGRTLVAILENYQKPDGSVEIPTALRQYMGGQETIHAFQNEKNKA